MDGKPLLGSHLGDSSMDLCSKQRKQPNAIKNAITLFIASIILNVMFCILSFSLPNKVPFITNASHLGVVHAVLYSAVIIIFVMMRNSEIPHHHRFIQHLLSGPFLIAMITNILVVFLLGFESWMGESDTDNFSSLQLIQIASVVQSAGSIFIGLVVFVKTNKPTVIWQDSRDGDMREEFTSFLNLHNSSAHLSIGSHSVDTTLLTAGNDEWLLQKLQMLERREKDLVSTLESILDVKVVNDTIKPESNAYDLLTKYSRPGQTGPKAVSEEDIETLANSILRLSSEHQRLMNEKQEVIDRENSVRGDLQKAHTEMARLRQEIKDSKRRIDSVSGTLQIEREKNAASEQLIQSLRERIELLEHQHPMNTPLIQGNQYSRLTSLHRSSANGVASGPSSLLSTPIFSPPNSLPSSSPVNNPIFTRDCEQARSIITALATGPAKNRQHVSSRAVSFNTQSPARTVPGPHSVSFGSGTQSRQNQRDSQQSVKNTGEIGQGIQSEAFAIDKTSPAQAEKRST